MVQDEEDEARLMRSVALQTATVIRLKRQRAEEALEQALAMMRATLEATSDGILVTDAAGTVTGLNERFLQMWGLSREVVDLSNHHHILQRTSQSFDDPRGFAARVEEIYASAPPESYDLLTLSDGRAFERSSRPQVIDGQNVGRVWSFHDITERRRSEAAAAKQAQWFQVTLASIGDAVITTDTQGRVTFLNGAAEALTGWTQAEATGQPLETVFDIVNETTREPIANPAARALREGQVVGLANHTLLRARNGSERPIDDSAAPILDGHEGVFGVVLVFRDVTAQRAAERALRELAASLSDADGRKNEFLAMLAHELRNPLAPIRNALRVIRMTEGTPGPVTAASAIMERQVSQMVRLVDDLLDVSRISRGKVQLRRETIDLAETVSQAIEGARPLCDSMTHTLTVSLPETPVFVDGGIRPA